MEYRTLGKSGIQLSEMSLGSWLSFGEKTGLNAVKEMCHFAFDHGIIFFDNAEVYANGGSELLMGEALRDFRRDEIVVSTKIFFGGDGPNKMGHSMKRLIEGTKNSLRRLQMDHVDLLYCHRRDENTSVEEAVRAMDILIRQGHALYWGTSEWEADDIKEAHSIARQLNTIPPSVEQPEYNMFHRQKVEHDFIPLFKKYGMGITSYSPTASGVLTGKYRNGIPKGSRLDLNPEFIPADFNERVEKAKMLHELSDKVGCTLAQFAIAWCLKNPNISTVMVGASKKEQLVENLKAAQFKDKLTDDVMKEVENILSKVTVSS
ncbi:MAG: L-glyceraldehyde 3-phosphate reductase [Chlamydiae bacterium]|nr:L-glyceraldehyde 3-phosphate reductase [Chlamydiota bacterium]